MQTDYLRHPSQSPGHEALKHQTPSQLGECHSAVYRAYPVVHCCLPCLQAGYLEHTSQIPGYEALGCVAPSPSAFVVRADALQKCNWEPTYSRASHVALGQELKLQGFLSHYVPDVLAVGKPRMLPAAMDNTPLLRPIN